MSTEDLRCSSCDRWFEQEVTGTSHLLPWATCPKCENDRRLWRETRARCKGDWLNLDNRVQQELVWEHMDNPNTETDRLR